MRRSLGLDVLACPRCGDRMELIAALEDIGVARRILDHMGLASRAPPRGPPWRPQRGFVLERPAGDFDGIDAPAFAD